MVLGELDSNMQKNETRPLLHDSQKINSKSMKNLKVRQETMKTLEEKAGNNLSELSLSNFLLDTSPKARELKAKVNYCDIIKIKSFCTAKETVNKTKRQPTEWKRYLQMTYRTKG